MKDPNPKDIKDKISRDQILEYAKDLTNSNGDEEKLQSAINLAAKKVGKRAGEIAGNFIAKLSSDLSQRENKTETNLFKDL